MDIEQAVPALAAHEGPTYSAAEELERDNIDVAVLHVPTIKPLDVDTIARECAQDRLVLTVENHSVVGGLGEAVASALAFNGSPRAIRPVALPDEFLGAGALPTLHDRYGLSTKRVVEAVRNGLT